MDDTQMPNDNFDEDKSSSRERPAHIEALMRVISSVQEVQSYIYAAITHANLNPESVIGEVNGIYDDAVELLRESDDGANVDEDTVRYVAEEIALASNASLSRFEQFARDHNINLNENLYTSKTPFGKVYDPWSLTQSNFETAVSSAQDVARKIEPLRFGTLEGSPSAYDAGVMNSANLQQIPHENRNNRTNELIDSRYEEQAQSQYYQNLGSSELKRANPWSGRGSYTSPKPKRTNAATTVQTEINRAEAEQKVKQYGRYNPQTSTVEVNLSPRPTATYTSGRIPGGRAQLQDTAERTISPSANIISREIAHAQVENTIQQRGGYDTHTGTVRSVQPQQNNVKNPLPSQASVKAEQNRFGALRDINAQRQKELVISHEDKKEQNRASTQASVAASRPSQTTFGYVKQQTMQDLNKKIPQSLPKEDKAVIGLANTTRANVAASHTQKVIASGGTEKQAKQQLDAVAAIYARGNPDEIRNWENFVKMKQAEKANITTKPTVAGGSADAMERSIANALRGQSSFVQNSVRAEINKGNKSDVSSLVKWFSTQEKNSATRVPSVPRSSNTRTSNTVIPTSSRTSRGTGGAGTPRMM